MEWEVESYERKKEINIWIREGCEFSGDKINPKDDGQNWFLLAGDG